MDFPLWIFQWHRGGAVPVEQRPSWTASATLWSKKPLCRSCAGAVSHWDRIWERFGICVFFFERTVVDISISIYIYIYIIYIYIYIYISIYKVLDVIYVLCYHSTVNMMI